MLINCTPHSIHIVSNQNVDQDPKTKTYVTSIDKLVILQKLDPSGILPRVRMEEMSVGEIDSIPIKKTQFGEIENIPAEQEGVLLIVSGLVAKAGKEIGRNDLLAPGALVRNKENPSEVLGCLYLIN